jgi:hypothetical protein
MNAYKRAALALALLLLSVLPAFADQGSLCMPTSGTVSGLAFAQDVNAALKALATSHSGDTAPTNDCTGLTLEGQVWLDTSTTPATVKMFDGAVQQVLGTLDAASGVWTPPVGGGATSIASASTTDLWSVAPAYVTVSGSTTITKLAGSGAVVGTTKFVRFSGALQLTYNATQLILPGGASITTAAGDTAQVIALGGGNVLVFSYVPASGRPPALGNVDNTADASKPVSTAQAAADLKSQTQNVGWNLQTSSYTLVLGDAGKLVSINNGSANTLTVPTNASVAFPLYTRIDLSSYGAGQMTVAAASGVTIHSAQSRLKLNTQYSGATLFKVGTNEWLLFGDLL